jgi:hypothetical protein
MILVADDAEDIPKICLVVGKIIDIKTEIKIFCETD